MKSVNDKLNSEVKSKIEDYLVDNKEILDSLSHMDGILGDYKVNEGILSVQDLIKIRHELGPILNNINDDNLFIIIKKALMNSISKK